LAASAAEVLAGATDGVPDLGEAAPPSKSASATEPAQAAAAPWSPPTSDWVEPRPPVVPAPAADVAPIPEPERLDPGPAARLPAVEPSPQGLSPPTLSPSVTPALGPVAVEPLLLQRSDPTRPTEERTPPPEGVIAPPPCQTTPEPVAPLPMDVIAAPDAMPGLVESIPPPLPPAAIPLPPLGREAVDVEPRPWRPILRTGLRLLIGTAGLLVALLVLYRWVDPPASALMLGQRLAGVPTTQRWVPLERMSPNLFAAVIASEDGHFCRHHGVDWGELKEAIEGAGDGMARGGSTISMQVVKNLFLWPSRSYVRKAIEIPLAFAIEALWSKRRILEIYLNIAEWGPGIFGAEAAARYHFRKPALLLTTREAALLAVALPNPFERQAGRPGPGTQRLADNLLLRMRAAQANTACVRTARHGG
jgi:monofunctional biosynthetic peptidoglycan transglycosylase